MCIAVLHGKACVGFRWLLFTGNLTGLLGALTETEREMISVERMDEYGRDGDKEDCNYDQGLSARHSMTMPRSRVMRPDRLNTQRGGPGPR